MLHGSRGWPHEVNSESNLNCDDINIDELGEAFKQLFDNNDLLKKKFSNFKNENEVLQSQLKIISKEKENISISLESIKKNFDVYKVSFKAKTPSFDKNEICALKNKVDCLGSTLSYCFFDYKRLESLF